MQEEKGKGFCTKLLPLISYMCTILQNYHKYHDKYHIQHTSYITQTKQLIYLYIYIKLTLTCTTRAPLKKASKEIV